jgi:hypothetical protein
MKSKSIIPLLFFVCIFSISLISAAPPVTTVQQISEGYLVLDSPQELLKQNANFSYNFFVYNLTNGALKTNTSISCVHYISDSHGNLIFYSNVLYHPSGYWSVQIDGGNFSNLGYYYYGTRCNSSSLGGAEIGTWKVTPTGEEISDPQSRIIIMGFWIMIIISVLLFIFGMNNPIIGIKIFSIGLAVLLIIFSLGYTLMTLNYSVGTFTGLTGNFNSLYFLAMSLLVVGGIGLILFIISFAFNSFYKSRGMRD